MTLVLLFTGNVAYNKTARQAGTVPGCVANNAVDGNIVGIDCPYSNGCQMACSRTYNRKNPTWWQVDLGSLHVIKHVRVITTATKSESSVSHIN